MTCRVCGCTDGNACVDAAGTACCWAQPDLCSFCVTGADDIDPEELVFVCPHCHQPSTMAEHSLFTINGREEILHVWFDCRKCFGKVTPAELEQLETVEA